MEPGLSEVSRQRPKRLIKDREKETMRVFVLKALVVFFLVMMAGGISNFLDARFARQHEATVTMTEIAILRTEVIDLRTEIASLKSVDKGHAFLIETLLGGQMALLFQQEEQGKRIKTNLVLPRVFFVPLNDPEVFEGGKYRTIGKIDDMYLVELKRFK